jgi:hypothetical protein
MHEKDEILIRNYRLCFGSPAGRAVLEDLAVFCHFRVPLQATGGVLDPNNLLVAEGARHVFLRIVNFMNLTQDQILALHGRRQFVMEEEDAA